MHAIILIYLLHHVLIRGEKKIKKNRFFKIIIFCEYNRFLKLDERNKNFEKNWLSGKLVITVKKVLTSIEFGQWTNPFGHLKIFFCINLCTKFQVNKLYISRVREVEHFYPPPLGYKKTLAKIGLSMLIRFCVLPTARKLMQITKKIEWSLKVHIICSIYKVFNLVKSSNISG